MNIEIDDIEEIESITNIIVVYSDGSMRVLTKENFCSLEGFPDD